MRIIQRAVIMAIGILGFYVTSYAQPITGSSITLPEIVVVSTQGKKSNVIPGVEQAKRSISKTTGGVDLIAGDDYKTGRSTTIQDVLSYSPGIFVQQRDTGAQESRVSIRGSGLQRTFHLRGIQLLQDGVPLNEADGSGDFYKIEPLATAYTEVYRGGNALRYGATTLGGAINFVSPTGYNANRLQARVEGGSFGYIRSQLSSGEVLGNLDYYVSLSQFKQEGFRTHTTQDTHYEFANVGYKVNDALETRFYFTNALVRAKLGGALRKSQLKDDPTQANASSVSVNQKRDVNYFRVANKTTYKTDEEQKWDFSTYLFNGGLFHPIFQVLDVDSQDYGGEIRYTNTAQLWGRDNQFLIGFNPSLGYKQDNRFTNVGGIKGSRTAENDQEAYNLNLYAEDQFKLTDRFTFVPGLQLSYASRQSTDYYFANGDDSGHSIYRAMSPKAGFLYDVSENTQVFAGYTRGFEPPTFSELFDSSSNFLPNKAQRSHTWETGFRGEEGRFGYDATYYYSLLDKELLSLSDGSGNPLGTINARGKTIHQGIELGGKVDIIDSVYVHGVYNLSRFRFSGDDVYGHNQLPGLPEHFMKLELMYEHPLGFYFGPHIERSISKYPIDMANTYYADPYTIWGLKAGYKTTHGFSVFVEGKNLSNKIYAASTSIVNNAAGADSNAVFNPGNGRAWYAGVEWKY
jgi:iron complex outermembrane receptor protein